MINEAWVINELRRRGSLVIDAYPGFGKSRLAVRVAKGWVEGGGRVLIMTRSRMEALQLCGFFSELGLRDRVSLFLGREVLCPFNAQSQKQCLDLRLSGVCKVKDLRSPLTLNTCDLMDYIKLSVCPYEVNRALAHQLPIVVVTHAFLSNNELYLELINILNEWGRDGVLLIMDEFHNVIPGVETVITLEPRDLARWAHDGNKLARRLLQRIGEVVAEGEEVVLLRGFDIEELLEGSEGMSDLALKLLMHHGDDLCAFTFDGRLVRLRCLSLRPIRDLVNRVSNALFLSASVSRRFMKILSLVGLRPGYVDIEEMPRDYAANLRVFVAGGLKLTLNLRVSKPYVELINDFIRHFVNTAPPAGGLAVFFPSIEYLSFFVNNHLDPPWGVPVFVLDDSSKSSEVIDKFREEARWGRSLLITYAQSPVSEGINFLDNELVGIMIVGFPLPQFSQWGSMKARFYSRMGVGGFTTTYLFPAVSLTVQIIGRLLRDLDRNRKVALLLDERFYKYRRFMPRWLAVSMRSINYRALLKLNPWAGD
ncbi:helicase C-terminal domain-containing protein [Vulcanisaeta thermophila]|uniref:helicase C-terminal domain-containing protein n=1 Tax=Vulcanisaeta thermophila TaxID=867917 RepID=UPI00085357EF|nr:helicase C-terminal domain-containing protein [Vulcanisaeta thermophila]